MEAVRSTSNQKKEKKRKKRKLNVNVFISGENKRLNITNVGGMVMLWDDIVWSIF